MFSGSLALAEVLSPAATARHIDLKQAMGALGEPGAWRFKPEYHGARRCASIQQTSCAFMNDPKVS